MTEQFSSCRSTSLKQHLRRRFLLLFGGGCAAYAAYTAYHLPVIARARSKAARYLGALSSLADAACSTADTVSRVSADVGRFLRSDSDDIPTSLRQLSKIARSQELSAPLARISEAVATGALRGAQSAWGSSENPESPARSSSFDQALGTLFSSDGVRFTSTVAESFGNGLVLGFYSSNGDSIRPTAGECTDLEAPLPWWVALITGDRFRRVLEGCVQTFVTTAVTVYLDKTMDINTYEDFFTGLTNPRHEAQMKEMLAVLCNRAVETFIRTTHQVLTSSNPNPRPHGRGGETAHPPHSLTLAVNGNSPPCELDDGGTGWIDGVSSVLAVPSNRRFVLDMTGRVTFETMRSFLDYVGWNLYENGRRGAIAVRSEFVERGREVVKCIGARSIVILTLCFCLCLLLLTNTRGLIPI